MEHAKKMALVPQNLMSTMMQQLRPTPSTYMSELDTEMKKILDDTATPTDVKAKQYSQALHRFLEIRQQELPQPVKEPVQFEKPPLGESSVIEGLPNLFRNKARMLFSHLKTNPQLSWNDMNELVYKGQAIPNSNIIDLIHMYTRPYTQRYYPGWREFGEGLMSTNVARNAIGNERLWEQIEPMAQPSTSRSIAQRLAKSPGPKPVLTKEKIAKRIKQIRPIVEDDEVFEEASESPPARGASKRKRHQPQRLQVGHGWKKWI